jgi:hypothetical protein
MIGAVALAVSAPWWIYNFDTFGSVLPISGQAQQMLNPDRRSNLKATVAVISDAFYLNGHMPLALQRRFWVLGSLLAVLSLLAFVLSRRGRRSARRLADLWTMNGAWIATLPVVLLALALTIYYSFFFGAPHFQFRYLVIVRIVIFLAIVSAAIMLYGRARGSRIPLALLFALYLGSSGVMLLRSFLWPAGRGNIYVQPAEWILANVPADRTVGMFQSGTTGFLAKNVENLDGKVNARALAANIEKRMPRYIDSASFDYIIDWDMFTRPLLDDPLLRGRYAPIDTLANAFVVWKRLR